MMMDLAALFLWSFLAATFCRSAGTPRSPQSSIAATPVVLPVTIATLGNYLGACTTYALAMTASKGERAPRRMESASSFIHRYGAPALLLSSC